MPAPCGVLLCRCSVINCLRRHSSGGGMLGPGGTVQGRSGRLAGGKLKIVLSSKYPSVCVLGDSRREDTMDLLRH